MGNVLNLITTDGTVDATKIAAWIGCIGVVWAGLRKTVSAFLKFIARPRIAEPTYGCGESVQRRWPHLCVDIENSGRSPLNIEQVRLECNTHGTHYRCVLPPDTDGPIPAKRGIDRDDSNGPWKRAFLMPQPDSASEMEGLKMILDADVPTLRLQVWVVGQDRPLWERKGDQLERLRFIIGHVIRGHEARQSGEVR